MNQRKKDQKKKARKIAARKKVLARREELRKSRKEEEILLKEFLPRESKYKSKEEITQQLEHNLKILEQYEQLLAEQDKSIDKNASVSDNNSTPLV